MRSFNKIIAFVLGITFTLTLVAPAAAQKKSDFEKALAKSVKTGFPLLVFGSEKDHVSDVENLRKDIENDPDLNRLMSQFVVTNAIRGDAKFDKLVNHVQSQSSGDEPKANDRNSRDRSRGGRSDRRESSSYMTEVQDQEEETKEERAKRELEEERRQNRENDRGTRKMSDAEKRAKQKLQQQQGRNSGQSGRSRFGSSRRGRNRLVTPFVVIVDSKGDRLFVASEVKADSDFKDGLIGAIRDSGGVRRLKTAANDARNKEMMKHVIAARDFFKEDKTRQAFEALRPYIKRQTGLDDADYEAVIRITGLKGEKLAGVQQLEKLIGRVVTECPKLIDQAVEKGTSGKSIEGGAELAELERLFSDRAELEAPFDDAWGQLLAATGNSKLKRVAQKFDAASLLGTRNPLAGAEAFKKIAGEFPDSRISALADKRSAKLSEIAKAFKHPVRVWKNKSGKFSVAAAYLKTEDGKVHIKTKEGKILKPAIESLSTIDQEYLKSLGN